MGIKMANAGACALVLLQLLYLSSLSAAAEFQYFYLVRQWAGSFCDEHHCLRLPWNRNGFSIHGLWPDYGNGTWPEYCDKESHLNATAIADLKTAMEKKWPSLTGPNEEFWNHEWTRHGTCAQSVLPTQHDFFSEVLDLHKDLNIEDALARFEIFPSPTHKYKVSRIRRAIRRHLGVEPLVHCSPQGELSEIWMCIDKDLQPFSCNQTALHERYSDGSSCVMVTIPPMPPREDARAPSLLVIAGIAVVLAGIVTLGVIQLSRMYNPEVVQNGRGFGADKLRATLIRRYRETNDDEDEDEENPPR